MPEREYGKSVALNPKDASPFLGEMEEVRILASRAACFPFPSASFMTSGALWSLLYAAMTGLNGQQL